MKKIDNVIILAGGKGTRLSEQTKVIPKPLVKVGPDPAIVHIIRHFVRYGVKNVYIAGGYKFNLLAEELRNIMEVSTHRNDSNVMVLQDKEDPIYSANVKVIDTGFSTDTAERIKRTLSYLPDDNKETFITYGDSFSNVNLDKVMEQHFNSNCVATLTAVNFYERFGILKLDDDKVTMFAEKSQSVDEFINGGYIACSADLNDYILDTDGDFSRDTLPRLQEMGKLGGYIHKGFWYAVDSQRDWENINKIYNDDPENFLK